MSEGYAKAVELAIDKEIQTIGEAVALKQANEVEGLKMEGGSVKFEKNGKEVLSDLVDSYKQVSGNVASSLIAYELRDKMDINEIDLPENLEKHL